LHVLRQENLAKIWLNPGLNLIIFLGTGPSASNDLLVYVGIGRSDVGTPAVKQVKRRAFFFGHITINPFLIKLLGSVKMA